MPIHGVALGFHRVDRLQVILGPFHGREAADEADHLLGHAHEDVGLFLQFRQCRTVHREANARGDRKHVVDDVVELFGQLVDVLAIERCHEAGVEALEDVLRELVAAMLTGDYAVVRRRARVIADEITKLAGALRRVGSSFVEQVEEAVVGG